MIAIDFRRGTADDAGTTLALVDAAFAPDMTVGPFLTRLRADDTCLGNGSQRGQTARPSASSHSGSVRCANPPARIPWRS